jgi:drug/metabolite transporter (DMT)-like permease
MTKYWFYAFIALFLWGIHGPAGHYLAQNGVNMFFVFSTRLWLGTFVFFIYLLLKRKLNLDWKRDIKKVLNIAFVGIILNTILFHLTLIYLPGTYVMILENLAPIFVFIASLMFYGVKPRKLELLALLLSFIGIFCLVMGKSNLPDLSDSYYIGIILGVLTGLTFGAYIFFSADLMSQFKNDYDQIIRFLFKIFLISAIVCSPLMIFSGGHPTTTRQWFWLIEMGIFQSGLAYIFWNIALSHIRANTASILFLFTIIFTTINEVLFLNLKIHSYLVTGAILICLAGYIIKVASRPSKI